MKAGKFVMVAGVLGVGTSVLAMQPTTSNGLTGQPEKKVEPALSQENLPTAESLFERHIEAVGGLAAMKAERNRLVRGKFTGAAGATEGGLRVIKVAPNKMAQILEIPGMVTQEMWFDGEDGWARDTNSGTRRLRGPELTELKLQADILGECNYKERYKEVKTLGREMFAGVEAYSVRAAAGDRERVLLFDAKSGFLIGMRLKTAQGADSTLIMSEYKKFGGTMHPTKSVLKMGETEVGTIMVEQIETNLSVPPSVAPPDEVRAVK